MRMNLITSRVNSTNRPPEAVRYSLTVKSAYGFPGEFQMQTTRAQLLKLLKNKTQLGATKIERFDRSLGTAAGARLLDVELSEDLLTEIGYFIE
jgi:hypothetical protein